MLHHTDLDVHLANFLLDAEDCLFDVDERTFRRELEWFSIRGRNSGCCRQLTAIGHRVATLLHLYLNVLQLVGDLRQLVLVVSLLLLDLLQLCAHLIVPDQHFLVLCDQLL